MRSTRRRVLGAGLAAGALAAFVAGAPAEAKGKPEVKGNPNLMSVQLLSFNDYHGHLEATDGPLSATQDPAQTPVGGAEYLSSALDALRAEAPAGRSLTVAAGDLIGGSTFLSGIFHDEPSVETLNEMQPRRQQRGQPRVRRGHRRAAPDAERRLPPDRRLLLPERPVRRRRLPVARCERREEGRQRHAAARDLGQGGRRRQDRLHRDDPRGHQHPRQPGRGRERGVQGRGRDGQHAGPPARRSRA